MDEFKSVINFLSNRVVIFCLLIMLFSSLISIFTLYPQSIRLDESQSIWVSTKSVSFLLRLNAQDVLVPLYQFVLHFWLLIFGTSIVSARTLSLIFFILTIPVLYRLASEASNKKVGMLTITLFALSPFILWYSSETRMYTLFVLATSLNHLFFLRLVRSNGKNGKFGYFLSIILGFYSHYFFFFNIFTQVVFMIGRWFILVWIERKNFKSFFLSLLEKRRLFLIHLSILLGSFVFFLPWLVYVYSLGLASSTQPLISPPTSFNLLDTMSNFIFGFQSQRFQSLVVSFWPLFVIILFLIFTQKKNVNVKGIEYFLLVSFFPIIFIFLISFIKPIFLSRYLIFVTPTLYFIIAWILVNYPKKVYTFLVLGYFSIVFILTMFQNFSTNTPVREDYKEVATYLSGTGTPRDIIAVSAPFTVYPIEYSYKGLTKITTIPEWDRYTAGPIPKFSLKELDETMQKYKKEYNRIFLVLSYDQGYERQLKDYFDKNYKLEEDLKFSTGINVRVYKLRYDTG